MTSRAAVEEIKAANRKVDRIFPVYFMDLDSPDAQAFLFAFDLAGEDGLKDIARSKHALWLTPDQFDRTVSALALAEETAPHDCAATIVLNDLARCFNLTYP